MQVLASVARASLPGLAFVRRRQRQRRTFPEIPGAFLYLLRLRARKSFQRLVPNFRFQTEFCVAFLLGLLCVAPPSASSSSLVGGLRGGRHD